MSKATLELEQRLRGFGASASTEGREHELPLIRDLIERTSKNEIASLFKSRTPFKEALSLAIDRALRTPVKIYRDERIIPWEGGATVVAISDKGEILGGYARAQGRSYVAHGQNLYPDALTKALVSWHLDKEGRRGLEDEEDFRYVEDLGFKNGLSMGETKVPDPNGVYYIGVSGCSFSRDYMAGLFPPYGNNQRTMRNIPADFLTGLVESRFARVVMGQLIRPNHQVMAVSEHPLFSMMRRSHSS